MGYNFNIDFTNGSTIEQISGLAFLNANNTPIRKTDVGNAIISDGVNQRYYAPNNTIGDITTGDFSIECYIKFNDLIGNKWFIAKGAGGGTNGWSLYRSSSSIVSRIDDSTGGAVSVATGITTGVWYHVISTFDRNGNNILYIDSIGNTPVSIATRVLTLTVAYPVTLAAYSTGSDNCNCEIALARQYDKVLTQTEVNERYKDYLRASPKGENKRLFNYPKPIVDNDDNVVAHYNFKEGGNDTDITVNTNNGILSGGVGLTKNGKRFYGVNGKEVFGNIGNIKSISFRIKLATTTEQILEGAANDKLILANAGTLTYAEYDNAYVNGVLTDTITASVWNNVTITSSTDVDNSAVTLALNNANYGNFEIEDLIFHTNEPTLAEHQAYHNSFRKPILIDTFKYLGADGGVKLPIDTTKGTGIVKSGELSTYVNPDLIVGTDYIEFTQAGTILYTGIDLDNAYANGILNYWYYTGGSWSKIKDLPLEETGLSASYANKTITFTGANIGDRIANINIENLRPKNCLNFISDQTPIDQNTFIFQLTIGKTIYVRWGDGSISTVNGNGAVDVSAISTYSVTGTYNVDIFGDLDEITKIKILSEINLSGNLKVSLLTSLTNLYLQSLPNVSIGTGEIGSLTSLTYLLLYSLPNATIGTGEIGSLTSLTYLYLQSLPNATIGTGEIGSLTSLTILDLSSISSISIGVGENFTDIYITMYNSYMSQTSVDNTLARLVDEGYVGNTLKIDGATNAAPSLTGQADVLILEGRDWKVIVN